MKCSFVETSSYTRALDSLPDRDFVKLKVEALLAENPLSGDIVPGAGGLRKIRVPSLHKGKRGSYRVIYFSHSKVGEIYLIGIYSKNEIKDISPEGKKIIKEFIKKLKDYGGKNERKKD